MSAIEDIILDNDRRGISALRPHLPANFCEQAALLILEHPGQALICTGFYILTAGAPETDGPPGAYFLGHALESIGYPVTYVSDLHSTPLFRDLVPPENVVEFPLANEENSKRFAKSLLARTQASVVISIERCGMTTAGRYLNMRGLDISQYNAKLDYLFDHAVTLGIGDGGNEIGMGNLMRHIPSVETLPDEPTATRVNKLIIASVSNWGSYGLIAALSLLSKRNLLPSAQQEEEVICRMVDSGAVDGISTQRVYAVDGFSLEENRRTLERLNALLSEQGL